MALGPEGKKEANVTVDQTNGSKGRNGRDRGGLTQAEAHRMCERLLEFGVASAEQRFDGLALVRRVELKANPAKVGEFLFLAILDDGRRYEARSLSVTPHIEWCDIAGCTCTGFARTRSPIEYGAAFDD